MNAREPQVLRFGADTLIDPPEYFCNRCGAIHLWTGKPEHKYDKCPFCLNTDLAWFVVNDPAILVMKQAWLEERARRYAENAALLASVEGIIRRSEAESVE